MEYKRREGKDFRRASRRLKNTTDIRMVQRNYGIKVWTRRVWISIATSG